MSGPMCSICFDPMQTEAKCVNGHGCCRGCALEWIRTVEEAWDVDNDEPATCPLCRQELPNPDDYRHGSPMAQAVFSVHPIAPNTWVMWDSSEELRADYVITIAAKPDNEDTNAVSRIRANVTYPRTLQLPLNRHKGFTIATNMRLSPDDIPSDPAANLMCHLGDEWEVICHSYNRLRTGPRLPVRRLESGDVVEYNIDERKREKDKETGEVTVAQRTIG